MFLFLSMQFYARDDNKQVFLPVLFLFALISFFNIQ